MSYHSDPLFTLEHGDCVEVMAAMEVESVDAIVTDPPYGLEFMGKEWDRLGAGTEDVQEGTDDSHPFRNGTRRVRFGSTAKSMQSWHEAWAREALRVAKPGAHLLAFGGTRTYHRLASAIEDAGWEIRDCLVWAYASGFPKSLDVSKAIDKAAGAERGRQEPQHRQRPSSAISPNGFGADGWAPQVGEPVTAAAAAWDGWGTALKPAWEPIVLARKPLRGTVAANVQEYGTGALNIDATRIPSNDGFEDAWDKPISSSSANVVLGGLVGPGRKRVDISANKPVGGRWPANVLLTDPIFDGGVAGVVGGGETGIAPLGRWQESHQTVALFPKLAGTTVYGDSGTYSRFFLVPKSSRSDREPLLRSDRELAFDDLNATLGNTLAARRTNSHPTVKPIDLMRHLVRLVTPPDGVVLDPFLGSGTTAIAANMEGFRCIGIERDEEYCAIAVARLAHQPLGLAL